MSDALRVALISEVFFDETAGEMAPQASNALERLTEHLREARRQGTEAPAVIDGLGMPFGIQICSDNNRPEGTHLLAAQGAEAVIVPRATERRTWERWRTVYIANALTSCCYVLSVNRPRPEQGVLLGGASIAVAPDGEILIQTLETLAVVTLDRQRVQHARRDYPGYLPVRSDLYAAAWSRLPARKGYGTD